MERYTPLPNASDDMHVHSPSPSKFTPFCLKGLVQYMSLSSDPMALLCKRMFKIFVYIYIYIHSYIHEYIHPLFCDTIKKHMHIIGSVREGSIAFHTYIYVFICIYIHIHIFIYT